MRFFHRFTRFEKILLLFLFGVLFFSSLKIFTVFVDTQSSSKPSYGGIYSEGFLGEPKLLNPLFANLNSIDSDISSFLFRGLMKYEKGNLIDDIATHTLSVDKKVYTFTLKKGIKWHDGQNLTIDDVYFTYNNIVKSEDFENSILREGLKDVKISKSGNDKIIFTLSVPYKFFLTNLLIGIVPKHILEDVPVKNLSISEFNQEPVGLGPYKFESLKKSGNALKMTLKRFDDFYDIKPFVDVVEFNFYDDKSKMIKDMGVLSAIRPSQEKVSLSNAKTYDFNLNRYVALFFNTESKILNSEKVRLAFQLATNKSELLKLVGEKNNVNTPVLELKNKSWVFDFDRTKAQGALHESGWLKPEKVSIDKNNFSEIKERFIKFPTEEDITVSVDTVTIKGILPNGVKEVFVNDYNLKRFIPGTKEFSYEAAVKFGNLKEGNNLFTLKVKYFSGNSEILDTVKVFYSKNINEINKKNEEIAAIKDKKKVQDIKKNNEINNKIAELKKSSFRVNNKGEVMSVSLLTDSNVNKYLLIAEELKKQWKEVGIDVKINTLTSNELYDAIKNHSYDILLYGQDLGYNLDTYSYWHSSQADSGLNFSRLKNIQVDVLIEKIRSSHNEEERKVNLDLLQGEFEKTIPSIFLYSPMYYYVIDANIKGAGFENVPNLQDRFSSFQSWYINEKKYIEGNAILKFILWLYKELK